MTIQRNVPYAPAAQAPKTTDLVAHCAVCGIQWQVRSENRTDAKACSFCGASDEAISVVSEAPTYGGAEHT